MGAERNKILIASILSVLFIIICFWQSSAFYSQKSLEKISTTVENRINNNTKTYLKLAEHLGLKKDLSLKDLEQYFNEPFSIEIFEDDELSIWSSREFLPISVFNRLPNNGTFIIPYDNKFIHVVKLTNRNRSVIVSKKITNENQRLKLFKNGVSINFLNSPIVNAKPITLKNSQNTQFYITLSNSKYPTLLLIISWFSFIFFIYSFLFFLSEVRSINSSLTNSIVLGVLVIITTLMINTDPFSIFGELTLFQPTHWANQYIARSIGNLLINLVAIIILFKIWAKSQIIFSKLNLPGNLKFLILSLYVTIGTLAYFYFVRSSIIDSPDLFVNPNIYTSLLVFSILVLGLLYLVLIIKIVKNFTSKTKNSPSFVTFVCVTSVLFFLSLFLLDISLLEKAQYIFWLNAFLITVYIFLGDKKEFTKLYQVLLSILLFASFGTQFFKIYTLQAEKGRIKQVAKKLFLQNDAEILFDLEKLNDQILKDEFLKNQVSSPFFTDQDIINRLKNKYLTNNFLEYNLSFEIERTNSITINEKPIIENSLESFQEYRINNRIPIIGENSSVIIQMELVKSKFKESSAEILTNENLEKINNSLNFERISYYIFKKGNIIDFKGELPLYNIEEFNSLAIGGFKFIKAYKNTRIYVLRYDETSYMFIGSKMPKIFDNSLNTLAFVFSIIVYFYLILVFFFSLGSLNLISFYRKSLINKSLFLLLVFVYLAAIIIGTLLYTFTTEQVSNFQSERYKDQLEQVLKPLELNSETSLTEQRSQLLSYFENTNEFPLADIHLYDNTGKLLFSNNRKFYDNKTWLEVINPKPLTKLNESPQNTIVLKETLNGKTYKGVYRKLRNKNLENIGYLYLPEFKSQYFLKSENGAFAYIILNTISLVLLLITFLSTLLIQSISKIFNRIRKQFSKAGIGKELTIIDWKNDDEIGLLIDEYNNMVIKLDESAVALARTERESAWKDMAKQIAHEIKNPLTPMKLSIQHLKMRLNREEKQENEPIIKTLSNLEIQINHLTNIANDFSSIAKLASPTFETIDLKGIVLEVVEIFNHSEYYNIQLTTNLKNEEAVILGDHTQMNRVITNLVKNASQAIGNKYDGAITIHLYETDNNYIVDITDNGIGISIENRAKIFTPNFTTKKSGTGIGLMLSKKIIETHGGTITFESKEKLGTTFTIKLNKANETA